MSIEVSVELNNWKVIKKDASHVIAGTFEVKAGATLISSQAFNDGYGAITVTMPAELVVEAEHLGNKICKFIEKHFTGKGEQHE